MKANFGLLHSHTPITKIVCFVAMLAMLGLADFKETAKRMNIKTINREAYGNSRSDDILAVPCNSLVEVIFNAAATMQSDSSRHRYILCVEVMAKGL